MTRKSKSIRRFRSQRGRPKKSNNGVAGPDLGTPELILKRACGQTSEAIDICLERRIISEAEHRCAIHLRWLHTVRYGAPGITALDLSRPAGKELFIEDDEAWRSAREYDYHEAVQLLRERGYAQEIIPCVIYNERPFFLEYRYYNQCFHKINQSEALCRAAARFSEGLATLTQLWSHLR